MACLVLLHKDSDVSDHSQGYRLPNVSALGLMLHHTETSGDSIRLEEVGIPFQILQIQKQPGVLFLRGENHGANRGLVHYKPILPTVNLKSEKSSIASRVCQAKGKMQTCLLENLPVLQNRKSI